VVEEARLEDVGSGLAPVSDGWFVVNVRNAAWLARPGFGASCVFEGAGPPVRLRPDLEGLRFPELGIKLAVIDPGQVGSMYHAESAQEDFLVLAGSCLLVIEEEERQLEAWDFVHCPPGTEHVFVGAGDGPCAILMVGARPTGRTVHYPRSELAQRHGAGVVSATDSPREAYARFAHWAPERPHNWRGLPWA
jgi:uncharacterized cupin superfamily protein